MSTHLQQLLQSLCWEAEWNYAVFWKLKHRARMVLTWEDAYYNNNLKHDSSDSKSFIEALESLHDEHFVHDPLGLAVAKMSYHVYSVGEGIVGQVAVTGKHQWIFAGDRAKNSCLSPELCDGWQAQFSAGIKTVVVAAVVPHGVVQLGSVNKVNEDLKLLTRIRHVFSSLQDSSAFHIQTPTQCNLQTLLQTPDTSTRALVPDDLQEYLLDLDKTINQDHTCATSPVMPTASFPSTTARLIGKNGHREAFDDTKTGHLISENQQSTDMLHDVKSGRTNYQTDNAGRQVCLSSQSCLTENSIVYGGQVSAEKAKVRLEYYPVWDVKADKLVPSDPLVKKQKVEDTIGIEPEFDCLEPLDDFKLKSSFTFSGGSELYEALGPSFLKQCYPPSCEVEKVDDTSACQMPEATESSMLTSDSSSDHLLEAVVANFCRKDDTVKSGKLFSTSESIVTTEKTLEPSINMSHTIGSSCYSIGCSSLLEESAQNCLNSSDSYSLRCGTSAGREPLVRLIEPGKPNKKRARPGESGRPRPRDRQLIQDRIKELRELVPNGSKCSIDSLLERTIKHMVFLQSVTKHADKLSNCAKSRGCNKEVGVQGPGYEQGSSWAVEVGGHMKICPILVENLNMNGQMMIEMLCQDCGHFMEIAEAIKSLGLTILKGITDDHGDKIWMQFVVEDQGKRNLHRMDVLWSLVQILQANTTGDGYC